jgi:dihydroorotase
MKIAAALNMPVMDHALDPAIAGKGVMHDGKRSMKLGLPGIPSSAETEIVRRDIKLARQTGCHVHIQHVSARESVELIRQARKEGIAVSGEATPHHLAFTDDDITADNTNLKMNPPVRSKEDRKSLLSAVVDGTLEVLATDHAPHRADEKANDFIRAPFGVVGVETAAGVTFALLVKTGLMSISEWLRRWTIGPAHVLGLAPPALSAGRQADLAILDISSEWTVKSTEFVSKSKNTPFEGWKLACRPVYTFHRGLIVWTERQSKD